MKTSLPTKETQTRQERIMTGDVLLANIHLGVLFKEQRLCCANHSDEEIFLDEIGWKNFICPKCGRDYSIGRKVVIFG